MATKTHMVNHQVLEMTTSTLPCYTCPMEAPVFFLFVCLFVFYGHAHSVWRFLG